MYIIVSTSKRPSDRLVQKQRLADILDLGDSAFEVECLGQDNLENLLDGKKTSARPCSEMTDLLHIDAVTSAAEDQAGLHRLCESFGLEGDLLLVFAREIDKVIILGSNKEWDGCLVEAPTLAVPFFDGVQSALSGEIEHE